MADQDLAQLISGGALLLMVAVLKFVGRRDLVAGADGSYTGKDGTSRTVTRGSVIPAADACSVGNLPVRRVRRSWLGAIVSGADHRASTSKTVVFAWTLAVAFGLLSLLICMWLGDDDPWDMQMDAGLQEEYLLLLGGPFAAAVLAKYAATSQADQRTDAPVGEAAPGQLVNNDEGDTDLGDFQYVLFNVIGLMFFFGDFIGDMDKGFPDLPPTLTGLVLTSTGGYAAKKLLAQAAPTLLSVLPTSAKPGGSVQVFGMNLAVPSSVSTTGQQLNATVVIGAKEATVTAHDIVFGNDRLTVTVPADAPAGPAPISVARADGVLARDANGVGVLAFDVLPP